MKKERNARYKNQKSFNSYPDTDTRYYGLWAFGRGAELQTKLDPKRFQKSTFNEFSQEQLKVINHRKGHYFYPAKPQYYSYHCNEFCGTIKAIKDNWEKHFKPLIEVAVEKVNKPRTLTPGDCDLMMCGILEPDEANTWANYNNMINDMRYKEECIDVVVSLYSQFLHLLASQVEAVTVKILTKENAVIPILWWNISNKLCHDIYFGKVSIITVFNPAKLLMCYVNDGFTVSMGCEFKNIKITKEFQNNEISIGNFESICYLITNGLMKTNVVYESARLITKAIEAGEFEPNTSISMQIHLNNFGKH
ncbi:MAG: hypothetical protein E7602_06550 [Ruminococcaceae bacterium]|nr:hypothetical protein [Oscillospiraceae bacterium]